MKTLRLVLILLLAPLVLLALLYGWVVLRSPAPDSGKLVRTANRKVIWSGDPVEVQLHVNADKEIPDQRQGGPRKPNVVGLVIDHSGSMGSGDESPLEAAKSAAAMFARATAGPDQPVGAVAFDHGVMDVCSPGLDGGACAEAIGRIPPGGGTDIAGAVEAAHAMVRRTLASGQYPNAAGMIVLLSDGQSSRPEALKAADAAKADMIRIVTIGLGTQIDQELLSQMATSEADFHFTLDPGSLGDIYSGIAADFGSVIGYNGQLVEQFHYGAFDLERPPAGFRVAGDAARGRMEIRMPLLFQQRLAIPYTLRARKTGLWGLALRRADLKYVPDRNKPDTRILQTNLAPPILVISPWLFLWLYLPLLLYVLWWLFNRPPKLPPPPPQTPVRKLAPAPPLALRDPQLTRPREPEPTLFVGIGEAGGRVLTHLSQLLTHDRYLAGNAHPPFRLLHAGVRSCEPPPAPDPRFGVQQLPMPSAMSRPVRRLQDDSRWPGHLEWVPRAAVTHAGGAQLDLSRGSSGQRWLARLSLFDAWARLDPSFLGPWNQTVDWLKQNPGARIVLIASLESGTGGGVLSDFAFLLRQALPLAIRARSHVYALALADTPVDHAHVPANQHAVLEELERLTVAAETPQPAVYRTEPPSDLEYLSGRIEASIFDRFFLLQCPIAGPADVERELFSPAAAFAHILTERSLADGVEAYWGEIRDQEREFHRRRLQGTLSTAAQYALRFPAPEIARRLACFFVMEVLGKNRLVGVDVSPDGRRFQSPSLPANPLEEAVGAWQYLTEQERQKADVYRAYCQAAISGDPRTAASAVRNAATGEPTLEEFRKELREFATRWVYVLLNGWPEQTDEERAQWRSHKILLLHAALSRLADFGSRVLEAEPQAADAGTPDGGKLKLSDLLAEIQRHHVRWQEDARLWLHTLVDSEFTAPAAELPAAGLYRMANDERQAIGNRLREDSRAAWQSILLDADVADEKFSEGALYRRCFGDFLERQRGFLPRWLWDFSEEGGEPVPQLRLSLVTDQMRRYTPTPRGTEMLFEDLLRVADSQTRELDKIALLDVLRAPGGELRLTPLANYLATRATGGWGLRVDRQFPGADQIQHRAFAMLPAASAPELTAFETELRRIVPCPLTIVHHGDGHCMRLLLLETLIPIQAARIRRDPYTAGEAFVLAPEREGERLRREIEDSLGHAPPSFHPLIRLLAAAPRPRSEWVGILAEGCIRAARAGIGSTLVMEVGGRSEPVVAPDQEESWVWAAVNVAYGLRAVEAAQDALNRWRLRAPLAALEALDRAVVDWRRRADEKPLDSPERPILEQIALLIEMEASVQRRKHEESRA